MRHYETIFVCPADLPAERVDQLIEKVKSIIVQSQGKINEINNWGKRQLAYPIKHYREGIYVYLNFCAPPETVKKIERNYLITEEIIRYLTVKKRGVKTYDTKISSTRT